MRHQKLINVEFNQYHIVLVVFVLWFVFGFKNVLACLKKCAEDGDEILLKFFNFWGCDALNFSEFSRKCLIMFCFLQPIFVCIIVLVHKTQKDNLKSKILFLSERENFNKSATENMNITEIEHLVEVETLYASKDYNVWVMDYVLIVLPFSFSVSISSSLWVYSIKENLIVEDTNWGIELPIQIMYYELAYFLEIFAWNFAIICIVVQPSTIENIIWKTTVLSIVMCVFCMMSKYSKQNPIESTLTTMIYFFVFGVYADILSKLRHECALSIAAAGVHLVSVFLLINFHVMANGEAVAGAVLIFRIFLTVVNSCLLLCILIVGIDSYCAHDVSNMKIITK